MKPKPDNWIQTHWRPMAAWQYLFICLFDFFLAPIFMAWYAIYTDTTLVMWLPLTLQGGGLYHLSMGAIVGITSYSRTQEKLLEKTIVVQKETIKE